MRGRAFLTGLLLLSGPAAAEPLVRLAPPVGVCRAAVARAEQAARVPAQLLAAMARVESGRPDPVSNRIDPWPWTINAEGRPMVFDTKRDAIAAVRALQAQGIRSIDVGCVQVNLMHHPDAFTSLEEAFDPAANARYAAKFLTELRERLGDWVLATAYYHSATPEFGAAYQQKVLEAWPEEKKIALQSRMIGIPANSGQPINAALAQSGAPLPGLAQPQRLLPTAGRAPR